MKIIKTYIAADGKKFTRKDECAKYEAQIGKRREEKIAELLAKLNVAKRSHGTQSLSYLQKTMCETKRLFLKAAKGKRRYTVDFAVSVRNAAATFLCAHDEYAECLNNYQTNLAELKMLDTRFVKTKGGANE